MTRQRLLTALITTGLVYAPANLLVAQQAVREIPSDDNARKTRLELRVGGATDGNFEINQLGRMTVDGKGNVFVLDASDQRILMYDANFRPIRWFGRKGAGPGEFQSASWIGIVRDSLWVIDRNNDRVTGFSLQDRGLRAYVVPGTGPSLRRIVAVLDNGLMAGAQTGNGIPGAPARRGLSYTRVDERGVQINMILAGLPDVRSLVFTAAPRNSPTNIWRRVSPQPFRHQPWWTTVYGGTGVVLVTTVTESSRETDRLMVVKIGAHGDTLWRREFRYEGRRVASAEIRRVVDSLARPTTLRGAVIVPNRRMIEDSLERPVFWPPIAGIIAGIDGTIWLKLTSAASRGERYVMLSPDGVYEGTVELPPRFQLASGSRQQLWGWRPDSDGLPIIERHRILR